MYIKVICTFLVIQILLKNFVETQNACRTSNGSVGQCIQIRSCNSLYQLLRKKPLLPDEKKKLSQSQCGWQNNLPMVCCDESTSTYINNQQTPAIFAGQSSPMPFSAESSSGALLPRVGECGIQTSDRIIGGEKTKLDEHPWSALLEYRKYNGELGLHCGGTLINSRYVITAAHCIQSIPSAWRLNSIRFGENDLNQNPDCEGYGSSRDCADPHINVPVEQVIVHDQYIAYNEQQYNDIALVRLTRNVKFTAFIKPICLPISNELVEKTFVGDRMEVVGWGKTETRSQSNIKLKVSVTGVDLSTCSSKYSPTRKVIDSQVCAGGERGKDSCQGDSGGGLIGTYKDSRGNFYAYLAGVVSYGPIPCGQAGYPGVYTRVNKYIDWIQRNIRE